MQNALSLSDLLQWHLESGVDETAGLTPVNHLQPLNSDMLRDQHSLQEPQESYEPVSEAYHNQPETHQMPAAKAKTTPKPDAPASRVKTAIPFPAEALALSTKLASSVNTLDELRQAVLSFEGCGLKRSAKNTVFSDGNVNAHVMVIGEAPGEQEDEQGIPFCGKSGQLLDNVLRSIGLTRAENTYITNTIFWRPPGNRTPTPEEVAICAPFVQKHIALLKPQLIILAGAVAGSVLGVTDGVSKMRGKFHDYTNHYMQEPTKAVVIYHPSYLLRSPGQKAAAWKDMQMIHEFLHA